jgi:hypothetical protein
MKRTLPTNLPTEHQEQRAVIAWARVMRARWPELDLLYAIPNGARTAWSVAKRLRAEGVTPGVPDLCLPVAKGHFHAMYVEMKRRKGGRLSEAQRAIADQLRARGNFVVVARGADNAIHWITRYLGQDV